MAAIDAARRMLDPKNYGDDPMDDAYHVAKALLRAMDLLRKCYDAGHRNGWEDGVTNEEVFAAVSDFLAETDPLKWEQQLHEDICSDE